MTDQGWQVGPDGTVSVRPGSPLDQYAKISPVNAMKLQQLAATNSVTVKSLLATFDATDRALSQSLRAAVGALDCAPAQFGIGAAPPAAPPYDTGAEIPVGKGPKRSTRGGTSLSDDERTRLLATWPDKLGNLNGIPIADRSTANKTILQRDLDRPAEVAQSRGVTKEEVLAHPEKYGMAGQMMNRYNNALKVQDALDKDAANATDAYGNTPDILLMKYDPEAFGGDGAAAIAIGDPDKAANTSVMVSGLTTSVSAGTLSDGSGVNVYNEANKADWNNSTAVVQWMGYDAPDDLAVAEPNMARNGAQILAPDVNGLAVTHDCGPVPHDGDRSLLRLDDGRRRRGGLRNARRRRRPRRLSGNRFGQLGGRLPPADPTATSTWARRRLTSSPTSARTRQRARGGTRQRPRHGRFRLHPLSCRGGGLQSQPDRRAHLVLQERDRSRCSALATSSPGTGTRSNTTA